MKLLVTREIPQAGINLLKKHPEIELDYRKGPPLSNEELKEAIKDVDAIIPVIPDRITKEVIEAGKNLKVIATYSVGYDHIDVPAATAKKVYVANTPGDLTEAVAEHSLALMLDVGRRVAEADRFCRKGDYKFWEPMIFLGPKFAGKTLGIIGFGRIGQHFARIAKQGLNMEVLYSDPKAHPEAESLLGAKKVELDELLENSDVVSLHCNLCEATHHLLGEQQFRKMKPLAYLINTARGPIVNEKNLVEALKEGWIAGAGLDVYEAEPSIDEELKKMDNVVLTPHVASATWEARIQMATMAVNNVIDVLVHNKPPTNLVNKGKEDCVSTLA
jgi:glyoxylate reductase